MKKSRESRKEYFETLLHECSVHEKRLAQAKQKCAEIFPLEPTRYSNISDDQIEHVDQLVYRFTKLQDALGAKLFPQIAAVLREDWASLTVFDVLAELEKARALPSADRWASLREIRNQLAHDYQDDPVEGSRYLNELYASVGDLLEAARQTELFVRERVLPSMPGESHTQIS